MRRASNVVLLASSFEMESMYIDESELLRLVCRKLCLMKTAWNLAMKMLLLLSI